MTDVPSILTDPVCFGDIFRNRRVLVTGHTGFKGTWLVQWLKLLGAKVYGLSLECDSEPNHFQLLDQSDVVSRFDDICNAKCVETFFDLAQPEIVFHLAAQPLVRKSYREPHLTFSTNVIGTFNILQASHSTPQVRAIVCVTSDKVYENAETSRGYVETDRLGGHDPYSCSKACAELLAACFRTSYFSSSDGDTNRSCLLATARAGNVIGGGDWSEDRLVPDAVRAAAGRTPVFIRNPLAVRPWQHVLEPLAGYLTLGWKLLEGQTDMADAWNFGPNIEGDVSVGTVIHTMMEHWSRITPKFAEQSNGPHEAKLLKVDSTKSNQRLGWTPIWNWREAVARSVAWYREYYDAQRVLTLNDLQAYIDDARRANAVWVSP